MRFIDDDFNDFPVDFPEANPNRNEESRSENSFYPEDFPQSKSIIKVIGVGGGGCNVVTEIYKSGLDNIDLMICNTDKQVLEENPINEKIVLGVTGLGAGCDPKKGKEAAIAKKDELEKSLGDQIEMVFVTACLGGGTGTGAAPVIADIAKKKGKLVVGVVTLPPRSEGPEFLERATKGFNELRAIVDSMLVIDNQKMYEVFEDLSYKEAFQKANDVLATAVKTISEIVNKQGYVNVDMNDVKWIMGNSGMVTMGIGYGEGEDRAVKAVEEAFNSPLLSDCELKTSTGVLVNILCSEDNFKVSEEKQALENIKSYTGNPQKFKRGLVFEPSIGDKVCVIVLATGFKPLNLPQFDSDTIVIPENIKNSGYIKPTDDFTIQKVGIQFNEGKQVSRERGGRPVLITDDENEIVEKEKEPAYLRKNKTLSPGITTSNTTNYSISDNADSQSVISSNRYLHQTQD